MKLELMFYLQLPCGKLLHQFNKIGSFDYEGLAEIGSSDYEK